MQDNRKLAICQLLFLVQGLSKNNENFISEQSKQMWQVLLIK